VTEAPVRTLLHGRVALVGFALAAAVAAWAPPARAEPDLVFGMTAPFSGTTKEMGKGVRTGIEAAFAAQNAAGGIRGRMLKLLPMDDGFEPARTAAALKELVENKKVFATIGCVGTPGAAAAVAYSNERRVLLFGAVSGAGFLRQTPPDRYVFNYRASYAEETAAIVRYLVEVKQIAASRIAVLAQDDAFGEAGFEGVARVMRRYHRDPAKVMRVSYRRNTADVDDAVRTIVQHAKELGAVVMVATYKPAARFIEKLRDAGVGHLVFTNVSDVGSNELADELVQLGPGYADGVVVTQVVPPPTSRATTIIRYQEQLRTYTPGEKPGHLSLEGWIVARVLIEGLERAGKDLTTDTLIDALEGLRGLDLGIGSPLGFGPSEHQASHVVWGTVIDAKGALQPLALE
jgi:ABC-type branched-subunit amino acid transport system substrate-binding protein